MNEEALLAVIESLQAENQALLLLVGILVSESEPAVEALRRLAPISDEVTLNTPMTEHQREVVKAVLMRVLQQAATYREATSATDPVGENQRPSLPAP